MRKQSSKVVPDDVEEILKIKLCLPGEHDSVGWHYNKNGIYSVKSGYWLKTHLPDGTLTEPTPGNNAFKHLILTLKTAPKVKTFSMENCYKFPTYWGKSRTTSRYTILNLSSLPLGRDY